MVGPHHHRPPGSARRSLKRRQCPGSGGAGARTAKHQQKKALRYGILGAFFFRAVATLLAVYLIQLSWVKLLGAAYLLYLPYSHSFASKRARSPRAAPAKRCSA